MNTITFSVHGEPVAQGRPRITTVNGHPRAFDPGKSRDWKSDVRLIARQEMAGRQPIEGAVEVTVMAYKRIPRSFSKKKTQQALEGFVRPTTKPDTDNYVKSVLDSLNTVVFADDSQVVSIIAGKHYSDRPRVEVTIRALAVPPCR